jgi:branched-chain amino acid transport system substrate-binding protein
MFFIPEISLKKWSLPIALVAMGLAACNPVQTDENGDVAGDNGGVTAERPQPTAEGNAVEGDVIKVGLVASQSGPLQPWGQDSIDGARLRVKQLNEMGGIDGKQVQLLVEDSQSKPEIGKSAAEKLINEGVVALLGEVSSGITMQVANAAYEAGVPLISVGATHPDVTKIGANVFRVAYTDDFQGPVMAKFAIEELGLQRMAIMTDEQEPYSQGLSESFRNAFTAMGGEIVAEESYEGLTQTQFSGQLTNLQAASPDGVFLSGYFNTVGPIVRQADGYLPEGTVYIGGDGWDSQELLSSGGEAIVGGFFCNHYTNSEDRAEVQRFLDDWGIEYETEPGTTMAALGYDAADLMIVALSQAEEMNSRSIQEAIENIENHRGVSGEFTFQGREGNPDKRALVVRVQPDQFEFVADFEYDEVMSSLN